MKAQILDQRDTVIRIKRLNSAVVAPLLPRPPLPFCRVLLHLMQCQVQYSLY